MGPLIPGPAPHLPQNATKALIGPGDMVKDQLSMDLNERRKRVSKALTGDYASTSGLEPISASKMLLG